METAKKRNVIAPGAVVIGGSAGGITAVSVILRSLSCCFPLPILIVLHLHPSESDGFLAQHFNGFAALPVVEALDKMEIRGGCAYLAPAGYHLLVERDGSLALSCEGRVNYARPSIDVLFESAALVWKNHLVGVLLSGANRDGVDGLLAISRLGGRTVVQDPFEAESSFMPQAAILAGAADFVLASEGIGPFINSLVERGPEISQGAC